MGTTRLRFDVAHDALPPSARAMSDPLYEYETMNNQVTMSASARGWRLIRWPANYAGLADLEPLLIQLAEVPGVKYVPTERFIEVPQSAWALALWSRLLATTATSVVPATEPVTSLLALPALKRAPYFHQHVGASFLAEHGGGLCADPMGLGKTTTGLLAAELIRRAERPRAANLIIAPGYTRKVWLRELQVLGLITSEEQFCAVEGMDPSSSSFRPEADWWFVHYDVVHAWASRLVTNRRGRPVVAILDEMHWIKNPKAQRSKGAQAAAGVATGRIGLTGTPLPNRPAELWWPLSVLDGKGTWGSHGEFRVRYAGAQPDGYGLVDGEPTHTQELHRRLSRRYLRRELRDVGVDLPPLTHQRLETTFGQSAVFEQASIVSSVGGPEALMEALERGASGETLAAMHRLRKLTSSAKLAVTTKHVLNAIEQGEAVVIFVWERATARQLSQSLGTAADGTPLAFVATGEQPQSERDELVDAFQAGQRSVMITTYGAMREGVTLHRARMVVLHDLDWVPAAILQAEARVHRIGQRRAAISTWVMVEDSFDTILARHIVAKAETMQRTLGLDAAQSVVDELGLREHTGTTITDEAARLLDVWARWGGTT